MNKYTDQKYGINIFHLEINFLENCMLIVRFLNRICLILIFSKTKIKMIKFFANFI